MACGAAGLPVIVANKTDMPLVDEERELLGRYRDLSYGHLYQRRRRARTSDAARAVASKLSALTGPSGWANRACSTPCGPG